MRSPESVISTLEGQNYICSEGLGVCLFLALIQKRQIFLEGEAGVGKTEIAKVLAQVLGRDLIRLQCYEGLDIHQAAYEWNYGRQLIAIQGSGKTESDLFNLDYLIERPLLKALKPNHSGAPILLIDELDRADEAFEAFLLEILSDWQITIPEYGTIKAESPPIVIITSNRTREIHDALKRRCFYHWVDYPSASVESLIIERKVPNANKELQAEVVAFVQSLRTTDLFKKPGVTETIDWAQALVELNCVALDPQTVDSTMGVLLKYQDDINRIQGSEAARILADVQTSLLSSNIQKR